MTADLIPAATFNRLFEIPSSAAKVGLGQTGVVLSSIERGSMTSSAYAGPTVKYVARGAEVYRYGSRSFRVSAGRFLLVPAGWHGDVEIRRTEDAETLGLCLLLPAVDGAGIAAACDRPMLFAEDTTGLGQLLRVSLQSLLGERDSSEFRAAEVVAMAHAALPRLMIQAAEHLDHIPAVRASTRHEILRRVTLARSHLHAVVDRPVDLVQLSSDVGVSPFHLMRHFRAVFGDTPAAYHRRYRLSLARDSVASGRETCTQAAQSHGFADASTLAHAYRRQFGGTITGR